MSTRRDNGEGTIYQKSNKYWCAEIQIGVKEDGKPLKKSFSGTNKRKVKDKLDRFRDSQLQAQPSETATLSEEMMQWVKTVKAYRLKKESLKRLISTIVCQITPRIGAYTTSELNIRILQEELINDMYEEGASLSSIKKAKSALRDYYIYWIKREFISSGKMKTNIVDFIELPSKAKFSNEGVSILTDDETMAFISQLFTKTAKGEYLYESRYLIYLILNTGIRLGEALGIKRSDYNAENKTLTIQRDVIEAADVIDFETGTMGSRYIDIQDIPKTKTSRRVLPLNGAAILAIEGQFELVDKYYHKSEFLAVNSKKEIIWPSNLRRSVNRILKAADIDKSGVHMLRHTYASALFAQGVELKVVSELLGHSGIQITADTYVHVMDDLKYDRTKRRFRPYPNYLN